MIERKRFYMQLGIILLNYSYSEKERKYYTDSINILCLFYLILLNYPQCREKNVSRETFFSVIERNTRYNVSRETLNQHLVIEM